MSDPAIQVTDLGKRYRLRHQAEAQRYRTLRDVLVGKVKSLARRRTPAPDTRNSVEDFWALKDVSFEIKQGEVVGIIGRNGAGKSTLLKILSRITEPTTGRVRLNGRVASLLEVGTGFHPELTGRENVFLNGAILGMSKLEIRRKFDEIVAFADVEKFLDTPVKRYSSGMYVRLAFAVAAHLEPEILIVDEVLAVGDAQFQKKCLGRMQDVSRSGRTVLFVSHNMATIGQLCQKAIVFSEGRKVFSGSSEEAIDFYLHSTPPKRLKLAHSGIGFEEVAIINQTGDCVESIAANQDAFVRFRLKINIQRQLQVGFTIYNQMEIPLISSSAVDCGMQFEQGEHCVKVKLPTQLFSAGRYRVEGAVWDAHQTYHQSDCLCEFEVVSTSLHEAVGNAYRGYIVWREPWKHC